MAEKVVLVEEYGSEYGVNCCLEALHLPKSTWHYHRHREKYEDRYSFLRKPLLKIAKRHPEYGYRRATTELQEMEFPVNHKVVQKLQKHWNLSLIRQSRTPKPSPFRHVLQAKAGHLNMVEKLETIKPFQVLHTDFSELVFCQGHRKAQLIPLLDNASKVVLGWAVGRSADTQLALVAWKKAKRSLNRFGYGTKGIIVHQDKDPVFTGNVWAGMLLLKDSVKISYSENGAKGNTPMESFFSRFKSENHSIFYDCVDMTSLTGMVSKRMRYYNVERRHSSLGNTAPLTYLEKINIFFRRNH